jgi:hypothetical protein
MKPLSCTSLVLGWGADVVFNGLTLKTFPTGSNSGFRNKLKTTREDTRYKNKQEDRLHHEDLRFVAASFLCYYNETFAKISSAST